MLPKANRLRSNREFQRVYRAGRSWALPLLALHAAERTDGSTEGCRVGISVSKKVGKAVVRNRVRRRLREIVRGRLTGWKQGCDVILVVRAAAAEAAYLDLDAAVAELAHRARLAREPAQPADALYTLPIGGRPARSTRSSRTQMDTDSTD